MNANYLLDGICGRYVSLLEDGRLVSCGTMDKIDNAYHVGNFLFFADAVVSVKCLYRVHVVIYLERGDK